MKFSRGFTLLELMLSITLFSAAMLIAVSSLLGVISFQRKSSALQRVENNINFAVRSIMADIGVGDRYYCTNSVPLPAVSADNITPQSCWGLIWPNGGSILVFKNVRGEKTVYRINNGSILRCVSTSGACDSGSGASYLRLTAAYVNVASPPSAFYVDGAGPVPGDTKQPRVQIVVRASTDVGRQTETINIQSTVSQFSPDF